MMAQLCCDPLLGETAPCGADIRQDAPALSGAGRPVLLNPTFPSVAARGLLKESFIFVPLTNRFQGSKTMPPGTPGRARHPKR